MHSGPTILSRALWGVAAVLLILGLLAVPMQLAMGDEVELPVGDPPCSPPCLGCNAAPPCVAQVCGKCGDCVCNGIPPTYSACECR